MPGPLTGVVASGVGAAEGSGVGDVWGMGVISAGGVTAGVALVYGAGVTGVSVIRPVAGSMPRRSASAGL